MIKAVLFDLDNTLLDRDESIIRFIESQYSRMKYIFIDISQYYYVNRFIELDKQGYEPKEKVYNVLTQELSLPVFARDLLYEDYMNHFHQYCVPFSHIIDTLSNLKQSGYQLGIITNGLTDFQSASIKALRIERFFDLILISEKEKIKKPNAKIFQRALNRLQLSPEEAIFIGDHYENDVKAAENAGLRSIWKIRNQEVESQFPTFSDFTELIFIIEKLQ
ncbi:HAD family hydrolase [Oceanobacillus kimchii]|uniref:HAD family hydrolase n=1 Tax=Oceanobacillus kimchii TaxID=746691 RepID=UPI0003486E9E|nr:HAD family hydrolase [Oceanobacillus kimchii]